MVRHDYDHFIGLFCRKTFFKVNFVLYKLYLNFNKSTNCLDLMNKKQIYKTIKNQDTVHF